MKQKALITGASGGIGRELARIFAREGIDLILVARNADKLKALKEELENQAGVAVYNIVKDLSNHSAPGEIYEETRQQGFQVDYLVNNAGFGDFGRFVETSREKELAMIEVNITALTQLTRYYMKEMVDRGSGRVMNVASTAAFQPGPLMAVYYATKAYVLHLSEAIHEEVREQGVTVTALCPGPTESGFQSTASMEESRLVKGRKLTSSKKVAEYGYKAMMKGKGVAIHGKMNRFTAQSVSLLPRNLVRRAVKKAQQKAK